MVHIASASEYACADWHSPPHGNYLAKMSLSKFADVSSSDDSDLELLLSQVKRKRVRRKLFSSQSKRQSHHSSGRDFVSGPIATTKQVSVRWWEVCFYT